MKKILAMIFVSTLFISSCGSDLGGLIGGSGGPLGNNGSTPGGSTGPGVIPPGGDTGSGDTQPPIVFPPATSEQINPPVNGDFSKIINWLVNNKHVKYNKLFLFENNFTQYSFKDDFINEMVFYIIAHNFGNINYNNYLTAAGDDIDIHNIHDLETLKNSLKYFNVDDAIISNFSNSNLMLYQDRINLKVSDNPNLPYPNLAYYGGSFIIKDVDFSKINVHNLVNEREYFDIVGAFTNDNDFLTYKNPNSKKFILEGKMQGKSFKDAKLDEIFLSHYYNKAKNFKEILDNLYSKISGAPAFETNGETYYPIFAIIENHIYLGIDINSKKMKFLEVVPVYGEIDRIYSTKELKGFPDPNKEYKLIVEVDNDLKNKEIYYAKHVSGEQFVKSKATLQSCNRIKLDVSNSSIKHDMQFKSYDNIYCIDENNNSYVINDYDDGKFIIEYYNYDAMVEKIEFVKDYIRKK